MSEVIRGGAQAQPDAEIGALKNGDLAVWHIPQVPGPAFWRRVGSVEEGVSVMTALGLYDLFLESHGHRVDYCNANGLMVFDESFGDWCDWLDEETGEDDPAAYVAALRKANGGE